jgi:DNA gyrase subunit B/topoisomerase-4 subunit B
MTEYSAKDITVLEGLDPVRKRPGMYIGGVGATGLHHLVWEIFDNSVDEAMNGHASSIVVTLHKDGHSVTVSDDGRGIPVDIHPKYKKSALEVIFCILHAGAKFDGNNYKTSGGLHGVGGSVVNALSSELTASIKRAGAEWQMKFRQGKPIGKLAKLGAARGTGTTVFFRPDPTVFPNFQERRFESALRLPATYTADSRSPLLTRRKMRSTFIATKTGLLNTFARSAPQDRLIGRMRHRFL